MDFALSLYHKDVAEWKNKEPNDLAAKLSRDKLYNLFPEMSQDILSELLMAHDNNFKTTVEVSVRPNLFRICVYIYIYIYLDIDRYIFCFLYLKRFVTKCDCAALYR